MGFILFIMAVVGIVMFLRNLNDKATSIRDNKAIEAEALELAEKIKTPRGLEALWSRVEKAEAKSEEYDELDQVSKYNKNLTKIEILTKAHDLAESNPYRYYIWAIQDIDTPLELLKIVGKVITPEAYVEITKKYKSEFHVITLGEVSNTKEAKELVKDDLNEDVKELIKFRKIIESDMPEEEMVKKFNNLVSKSEFLQDSIEFYKEDNKTYYEQYLEFLSFHKKIEKLSQVPYAKLFIDDGYDTLEEILELSDDDILLISGIGAKRLEEINSFRRENSPLKDEN